MKLSQLPVALNKSPHVVQCSRNSERLSHLLLAVFLNCPSLLEVSNTIFPSKPIAPADPPPAEKDDETRTSGQGGTLVSSVISLAMHSSVATGVGVLTCDCSGHVLYGHLVLLAHRQNDGVHRVVVAHRPHLLSHHSKTDTHSDQCKW